jgi:ribonuclease BN (tRNA processing enzyme)
LECSFFANKPVETHLELGEAMRLIRYAKPKRAVLVHLYPEWNAVDFEKEVVKFSPPCEIMQARDGLRLEIN